MNIHQQLVRDGDLLATGHDNAIVGILTSIDKDGNEYRRVVYSIEKILDKLMEDGMTDEEAQEWFDFNIDGAYAGHKTPVYIMERWND
jgi:hypothetical protein